VAQDQNVINFGASHTFFNNKIGTEVIHFGTTFVNEMKQEEFSA
jgi:hypothetical protein